MDYEVITQNVKAGKAPIPTFRTNFLGGFVRGKNKRFEVRDFHVQGVKTVEDYTDLIEGESLDKQLGYYIHIPGTEQTTQMSAINFLTADEIAQINLLPEEDKDVLHDNITELIEKNKAIMGNGTGEKTDNTPPGDEVPGDLTSASTDVKKLDEMTKDDFARELIGMQVQFSLSSSRMQLEELYLNAIPMDILNILAAADEVKIKDPTNREEIVKACLKP